MDALPGKASEGAVGRIDGSRMLFRRMVAMGIAAEAVASREPEMFQHLKMSCATCEYPDLCARDLHDIGSARHYISAVPGWDDYCQNAVLLNALSELCWFRRASY
jgi:hypothetical protein